MNSSMGSVTFSLNVIDLKALRSIRHPEAPQNPLPVRALGGCQVFAANQYLAGSQRIQTDQMLQQCLPQTDPPKITNTSPRFTSKEISFRMTASP